MNIFKYIFFYLLDFVFILSFQNINLGMRAKMIKIFKTYIN